MMDKMNVRLPQFGDATQQLDELAHRRGFAFERDNPSGGRKVGAQAFIELGNADPST